MTNEGPAHQQPIHIRYELPLKMLPFVAGIGTAIPLWGDRAPSIFFATAAEVIALGAVAMALQGGFFRVRTAGDRSPRGYAMGTLLVSVGVGLAFAFGALARGDGGSDPHLAMTAGALTMGVAAFAVQALFGTPGVEED